MTAVEQGELGQTLQRFIDWARGQGWRYAMMPYHLSHFGRFLTRRHVHSLAAVSTALLIDYQRELSATRNAFTVNGYVTSLRALWRYLHRQELARENVAQGVTFLRQDYFVPHLYGQEELALLERALRARIWRAGTSAHRFSRQTQWTAFSLLRDCGLRVSEACRLSLSDFDPMARTLRIERTKFFKTRVIPLPRSTCRSLRQYLRHRLALVAASSKPEAFFVSMGGHRLGRDALERPFLRLLRELGMYQPRRRQGRTVLGSTNVHALRHSYAVRTLTRWQQQGCDVERLLPLLSGYMGHAHVTYTKHYLHLTPTLRQLASKRFADKVLPRLDHGHTLSEDD
jgi:site-specific recombinase XerD